MHGPVRVGDITVTAEMRAAINGVLDQGRFSEGWNVHCFEEHWARYVGTQHAVAVSSGTAALIVAIRALQETRPELATRRKVITTPLTYIADSNAIALCGMEPVYVDIDPDTFGLRIDLIEQLLFEQGPEEFGIILPVHLMGYPVNMPALGKLAYTYGIPILEDGSQAHGAKLGGAKVGRWGDLSVFSFYIAHNIQVGEFGAVNTDDPGLARVVRQLKANGRACDCPQCIRHTGQCPRQGNERDPRFDHVRIGYNFKPTEWSGAIAEVQLLHADEILARLHLTADTGGSE